MLPLELTYVLFSFCRFLLLAYLVSLELNIFVVFFFCLVFPDDVSEPPPSMDVMKWDSSFQILAAGRGDTIRGAQLQHFELIEQLSREPVIQILFSTVLCVFVTITSKSIVLWDCTNGHFIRTFNAETLLGDYATTHQKDTVTHVCVSICGNKKSVSVKLTSPIVYCHTKYLYIYLYIYIYIYIFMYRAQEALIFLLAAWMQGSES
jgi:hypothetical protein